MRARRLRSRVGRMSLQLRLDGTTVIFLLLIANLHSNRSFLAATTPVRSANTAPSASRTAGAKTKEPATRKTANVSASRAGPGPSAQTGVRSGSGGRSALRPAAATTGLRAITLPGNANASLGSQAIG